jgi:hypothetical protein
MTAEAHMVPWGVAKRATVRVRERLDALRGTRVLAGDAIAQGRRQRGHHGECGAGLAGDVVEADQQGHP